MTTPPPNDSQHTWQLAHYQLPNRLVLAPMAGVTDRPFRQLCRRLGAGLAVSEMVTSDANLRNSRKTQWRLDHRGESSPRSVQIAGTAPQQMAEAARFNRDQGADIIDINMGCPAKKVCNVAAGSALMKDELLVAQILEAVVNAVDIPVTLKTRTGWDATQRNVLSIAKIAENAGIQALAVHGRTRADAYKGQAEYDNIAAVKAAIKIPVIANGDIDSPEKARFVLEYTGADALMLGRSAQGRPWIFQSIDHYLRTGQHLPEPSLAVVRNILLDHLEALYDFYGDYMGVRIARKHLSWYSKAHDVGGTFWQQVNRLETPKAQYQTTADYFEQWINNTSVSAAA